MRRPHHTDPLLIASVAAGGAVGSLARYGLSRAVPVAGGWPLGTLVENLVGAFLLGLLLQALALRGAETPRLRWLRLTLGTGVLGGFTTYSALALETRDLLADGRAGVALAYAVVTVVGGTVTCLAGVALAGRARPPQPGSSSDEAAPARADREARP